MISRIKCAQLAAVFLIVSLLLPSVAFADAAKAAAYYEQATQAYQNGDLEAAADFLNKAYAEDPDLVYQYNRILALQGLGRFEEALQVAAALEAPMKADPQNRFEDISEVKAQLEAEVEKKRLADEQAQVEEPVEPAEPTEPGEPDPGTIEPQEPAEPAPNIAGIAMLAGGGALVVSGVLLATGILVPEDVANCVNQGERISQSEQADICLAYARSNDDSTVEEGFDFANGVVTTHRIAAISLIGAGAILGGVGAYLLFGSSGESASAPDDKTRFTLVPWLSGDGVGAVLDLRF